MGEKRWVKRNMFEIGNMGEKQGENFVKSIGEKTWVKRNVGEKET